MGRGFKTPSNVIVALCVGLAVIQSVSSAGCREGCPVPNTSSKYKYEPKKIYSYSFDTVATVQMAGADAQETSIKVNGVAQIFPADDCAYTLKFRQVTVNGPDKKSKHNVVNELAKPIRFYMSNDDVAPEICADGNDNDFSLNIKRGIISMFHTSDKTTIETDVFGRCPTSYRSSSNGPLTTIIKTRNLNQCSHREKFGSGLVTGIVDDHSEVKSTPLLNGDYTYEANVKDGIVESVHVSEEYVFLPFSSNEAGIRSKVNTKMVLQGQSQASSGVPKVGNPHSRSIIFSRPVSTPVSNINALRTVFQNTLKEFSNNNVGAHTAAQFTELIHLMRNTNKNDLTALYQQVKSGTLNDNKQLSRKVFFDAIFRVGTGDSVETLAILLKNRELNEKEQKLLYLSLNLVQSMTKESLSAVSKLLDQNPPKEAYLSVGHVVNKYCRDHDCEAADVKAINEKFVAKLGACKPTTRTDEDMTVAVLKGIRNTQHLVNPVLEKVLQCTNDKTTTRIRVSALQAFAANPCHKKMQTAALNILKNRNEDSEVRIEAYLAAVECPSTQLANEIKTLLDSEPVYQVGSYITTHLASVRSSTDSKREAARQYFKDIYSEKQFPFDPRRFSFNREFSYAVDALGFGSSIDSNVIYSQKSFLPRSARVNLTGELFGHSFNVMEFNGRQENLDLFVEHYFGPKGVLSTQSSQEMINNFLNSYKDMQEHARNRLAGGRGRRGVKEDITNFDKNVKFGSDFNQDLDLDFSLKFFGSELFFLSLGQNLPSTPKELLDYFIENLNGGMDQVKNFDYTFEHHSLFMDADMYYPTALGIPLKLSAKGSGAVRFEVAGQVDVRQMINDPKNSNFRFKFVPSSNVFVSGLVSIDALAVSTGLEVSGSVHSARGSDFKFQVVNGKKMSIELETPFREQKLFGFNHTVQFVSQDRGQEIVRVPLVFSTRPSDIGGCFDQVQHLLGIDVCLKFSLTKPTSLSVAPFPLSGPNDGSITITAVEKYAFVVEYNDDDPEEPSLSFLFDTPNSNEDRKIELKFESKLKDSHIMAGFTLNSVLAKLKGAAGFKNDDNEVKLYGHFNAGAEEHKMELGFAKKGNERRQEYTPIVNLNIDYKVDGSVIVEKTNTQTKYTFNNVRVTPPKDTPFTMNGEVVRDTGKLDLDLTFAKDDKNGKVNGQMIFKPREVLFDMSVTSNFMEQANGLIKLSLKDEDSKTGRSIKNSFNFVYGKDLKSQKHRIDFIQNIDLKENKEKKVVATKYDNKFYVGDFPLTIVLNGEHDKKVNKFDVNFDYDGMTGNFDLQYLINQKAKGDYNLKIAAGCKEHTLTWTSTRSIEAGDKSKIANKLETTLGVRFELNGLVGHKFTAKDADVNLQGIFQAKPNSDLYKATIFIQNNEKESNSNFKFVGGKVDYVNYEGKVVYGTASSGNFKVFVHQVLEGTADYTSNSGKGEANVLLEWKDDGRKLKATTAFTIQKPTYDVSVDFFYDFDKDNSKKAHFTTNNKVTKSTFDSKNRVEVLSEKYVFNIAGSQTGTMKDGVTKGNVEVVLPTGRRFTANINRELRLKNEKPKGSVDFKIADELPNKQKRQMSFNGKMTNADFEAGYFDVQGAFKYNDFNNKEITVESGLKNLKKGQQFSTGGVTLKIDGSMITSPVQLNVNLDEYDTAHAIFKIIGTYGAKYSIDVKGKYFVSTAKRPHSHELTATINVPDTKLEKIVLVSNGKVKEPRSDKEFVEVEYSGTLEYSKDHKVGVKTSLKASRNEGSGSISLELPKRDPINASGNYKYSHDKNTDTCHMEGVFDLDYQSGKKFHADGKCSYSENKQFTLDGNLETDLENAKKIQVSYLMRRENEFTYVENAKLTADGKVYRIDTRLVNSNTSPLIDVVLEYPDHPIVKLYFESQKLGDRKRKMIVNVENFGDFSVQLNAETDYSTMEAFYIMGDVHSDKLKLNKVNFDVRAKSGASKGVEFKILSDGQNVLSGSADFTTKVDKGHNIIEGKGNVRYYDKGNTITFKVIRNLFEAARDGEVGMGTIVNVSVGPQNIVVEFKATDKNFLAKYTTCQQTKQCVNIEARSQLEKSDAEHFKHLLMISVDLRELGYTHEFGLKADTARNGYVFEHSVDMHLQSQNKPQYQFNFYIQPKKSGAILTLPTRVVALETVYSYPELSTFGQYQVSGAFYLDKKNSPDKKAEVSMDYELKRTNKNVVVGKGEMRFVHSGLKPMVITGTTSMDPERQLVECSMEADVFQSPRNKIVMKGIYGNTDTSGAGYNVTVDVSLRSEGLKLNTGFTGHSGFSLERRYMSVGSSVILPMDDFKFGTFMYAGDDGYELLVQGFNEDLIQTTCQYNLAKLEFNFGSTLRFPGIVPLETSGKIKGPFMAEFHAKQGDLAVFEGHFEIGNELSMKVTSKGQNVFVGRVGLDQSHFLTSEYKIDENQINDFVKRVQDSSKADTQKAEDFLTEKYNTITKNFADKLKAMQQAMPDFTNVQNMYRDEFKQMADEMMKDDTIKAIVDFVSNVYEKISRIFDVIDTEYMDAYKKMYDIIYTFYEQFVETFNAKVLPDLKVLYKQIQELVFNTYEDTVKLLSATFSRVAKALKSVEEDFNNISKSISEIFTEISRFINDFVKVFTEEMEQLIKMIKEYIQQIPGFDVIKEQYNELVAGYGLTESFANLVREITSTFSDLLPSAEVKEFVQKFTEYIEKKLQGAEVKDVEELKQLYVMLIKAVRSVMDLVRAQNKEWSESAIAVPFTFEAFKRLPFVTSVRFSPLNYMKNERLVSFKDILYLYRPYGFDPFEMIPPFTLHGEIVDGSHVFTFDGRHYTFPGTCSYVLARDFVNGNFSLVAQLENGKMKSIVLVDKDGVVQVTNEGLVTLNGKSSELPIHLNSLHAWRDYYSVSLLTSYGAEVTCTTDLRVCHFTVSGYYLGKTRGLLGNGNSEPYDDYLLPSNKISENTIEFGNAYRTQSNCQPVAVADEHSEHEHSSEQCSRMFSESSPLRYCYLFVNPANYREACEHAVHEADDSHKDDAACNSALGYVSRCGRENIPVSMPSECHKCEVDGQKIEIGDDFSVKVPQKQSDIVVIVDTQLGNLMGELVQGIITDLRANLKQRDISDINIAVIGYNKYHKFLYFFTSNGKLDFTGKLQNVKTDGPEEEKPLKTGNEALDEFFESVNNSTLKLKEDLGLSADAQAFQAAMQYPFRAAATKTILAVRSDSLAYSVNPAKVFAGILSSQTAKNKGIGLHVITPVEELALTKDASKVKTIIGFDSRVVITYADKKRPNMGSVDLRNTLKYQSDMGTDLVEKNNGYVAVLQNYVNAKPNDRKNYINLLSYTLAEQISRTEIQSDCTCKLASGVYPETECEAKETKLLPPRKAAGRG